MAPARGLGPSGVHRIWVAHGLKPHLTKTFWTASATSILEKVARGRQALEKIANQRRQPLKSAH